MWQTVADVRPARGGGFLLRRYCGCSGGRSFVRWVAGDWERNGWDSRCCEPDNGGRPELHDGGLRDKKDPETVVQSRLVAKQGERMVTQLSLQQRGENQNGGGMALRWPPVRKGEIWFIRYWRWENHGDWSAHGQG